MPIAIKSLQVFTFVLSLLLGYNILMAQQVSKTDSLWFEEIAAKTNQLINDHPQAADSFAKAYFTKARSIRNDEYTGKGACLVQMSASLIASNQAKLWFDTAQVYLNRSKNYLWNGYLHMNYGTVLSSQYSFEKGINYITQSIPFFEKVKDTAMIAMAHSSLANAFHDFGNFEKGKQYALLGLNILNKVKEEYPGAQWALLNVLGINYDDNKEYDNAIATHLKALKIAVTNDARLSYSYNNLGNTYKKKGMLDEAEHYFRKSFELTDVRGNYHMSTIYGNLGDIARQHQKYTLAIKLLDSSLYYAKMSASPEKLRDVYHYRTVLFEETGDFKKSLEYLKLSIHLKDSLESVAKARIIYDMQEKYESRKKDKENRDLYLSNKRQSTEKDKAITEKKIILIASVLVIGLLVALAFILHRSKLNRIKRGEDLKMNQALFTGEQNERIRIARDLHDAVGQMLSLAKMNLSAISLNHPVHISTAELIDQTIEEVRNISHNLIPEDLNFGLIAALETLAAKVNATGVTVMEIIIAEDIYNLQFEKENELSIYRIVQEVISNMTRHAKASSIHLAISKRESKLVLSIKDNGIGMDTENIEKSRGLGWKNIKARVNLLDGEIKVSSEKLSGTEIEISIPG